MSSAEYAWVPTEERIESANVARLMARAGATSIDQLRRWSVADIDEFWDLVVRDLEIPFIAPYTAVRDSSRGIEWTTWFTDGKLNVASACVDRWRTDPDVASSPAVIYEDEIGASARITYAELGEAVDRAAAGLRAEGIGVGDPVAVFMPMIPEAVVALYAIAKVGALCVPLFSGFAPGAISTRLQDAGVKLVFTAPWTWRREKPVAMKRALDQALETCPSVRRVVVVGRPEAGSVELDEKREVSWAEFVVDAGSVEPAETSTEAPLLLGYTSGTTGKPKGAVLTHAGFLVKVASELAYGFDVSAGDTFFWFTDMGWIMGPLSTFGTHALGAALLLYEGAPTTPTPSRLWQLVERHRVTMLGVSPTLIRALQPHGAELPRAADLSSLRTLGSSGEPWNETPYRWLADEVCEGQFPIINFSGGTEVGGSFLCPYPVEPLKPCSLGGPSLGMDVDVVDAEGRSLRGQLGELVCRQPWPSMTRGVWGDPERYLETYWSMFEGIWRHGDWAMVDDDGQWFVMGRSDEAINIAGKRVGPAEVEEALVGHPAVQEAAAIGVPDAKKGESIWCFWSPVDDRMPDVSDELVKRVVDGLGKPFAPARVVRVRALPKTRSAKIMRQAIRAVALREDPGDLSGAENPEALDAVLEALEARGQH